MGNLGFQLLEAPNAVSVRYCLYRSRQAHYLELDFHLVTPIREPIKKADDFPTVF